MKCLNRIIPLLLLATSAFGDGPAASTHATLPDAAADALVSRALSNTPEIASARATAEAAQLRITPAGTLPDPFVSFTYQNDGRSLSFGKAEGSYLGIMATQTLPWPGKLSLAQRAVRSEAAGIEAGQVGRASLTVEARVRNAWYDLLLARAVDRTIEDRRAALSQIEESVRQRYAAGLAVQQDVLRAQVELARIAELESAQEALISVRTAELNRLTGIAQDARIPATAALPAAGAVPASGDLIAEAIARSPELAAAKLGIETSKTGVAIARKNFLPDFTITGGSMYRGSFEMGPMWQVGVGISVPLWADRRQQNRLAEAESNVKARTADEETITQELELRTRERIAQLDSAQKIAALYKEKILPLDELSLESALASYQAGKIPFISVLDSLNAVYSDRVTYASRLAEAAKWRVAIDEASLQPTAMSGAPSMGTSTTSGGANPASTAKANDGSSMSSMR